MNKEFEQGSLVIAAAGKEKEKYFVILKSDDEYAYLSDGKRRKVQNPKKKKLKHITALFDRDESVAQKLKAGGEVTNKEVKRAIFNYLKRIDNN